MKVVHIESGLGNQMLSYCEYLALKSLHPDEDIYIETMVYDIPKCNEVIRQWNGYELKRIFGIDAPNIKEVFTAEQWKQIMKEVNASEFWNLAKHNWNYPVTFTKALNNAGLNLINVRGDFEASDVMAQCQPNPNSIKYKLRHCLPYYYLQAYKRRRAAEINTKALYNLLFDKTKKDVFTGQRLLFKYKGAGIEKIENQIRTSFVFPQFDDKKNIDAWNEIKNCNSVAIHARRGDMLGSNGLYYQTGFFKRAMKFIKDHVEDPVFYIFCDPGSVQWAMDNAKVLGLNTQKDIIKFVDWNKSTDSYRDMQLMAACKHQVITNSSFGWWASWLNENPNKITISPEYKINTTHTL